MQSEINKLSFNHDHSKPNILVSVRVLFLLELYFPLFSLGCFSCAEDNGMKIYNVDPLKEKLRLRKFYFNCVLYLF